MTDDKKIYDFGQPQGLPKWTARAVSELSIPRCCLCGSRLPDRSINVCGPCLRPKVRESKEASDG